MTTNADKLAQLVLYIIGRVENPAHLGMTKIQKILWFSETEPFARTGHPISGAGFVRADHSPYCPESKTAVTTLQASGRIVERKVPYDSYTQRQFISLAEADLSMFTAEEISIVDYMIDAITRRHTARSISEVSHSRIWERLKNGAPMPLTTVFGTDLDEPDEQDFAWAADALSGDTVREWHAPPVLPH